MKLATYVLQGRESFGVVTDGGVCDIPAVWRDGPTGAIEAISAGRETLQRLAELGDSAKSIPLDQVRLLAPIPRPPKLIGLAVNYVSHHREFDRGQVLPDDPSLHTTPRPFLMPVTAVIGPGETIPWPAFSRQIDYEVELAAVIGTQARCVSPDQAEKCIFGYTIANDISARSATHADRRTPRPKDDFFDWLHGKWADGFCPLGPWIVSAEAVGDPQNLQLGLTVNGETRQETNTSQMIFSVRELVSFISHLMTLTPGDVIATGTPAGVAMASGKYLAAGDVVTCRIEKIGELTNTIGPPPENFYAPCHG